MRIISDFNDYYDCIQAYGSDQSFVYQRHASELWFPVNKTTGERRYDEPVQSIMEYFNKHQQSSSKEFHINNIRKSFIDNTLESDQWLIGFCGIVYPVIIRSECDPNRPWKTNFKAFFDIDDYSQYLWFLYDFKKNDPFKHKRLKKQDVQESITKAERLLQVEPMLTDQLFFEWNVPVFVIDPPRRENEVKVTLNANVSEYELYKVIDPYTAFQDISMYISGVLGVGHPDTVDISDEDMQAAKGFTDKYSFRRPPTKPNKRK